MQEIRIIFFAERVHFRDGSISNINHNIKDKSYCEIVNMVFASARA